MKAWLPPLLISACLAGCKEPRPAASRPATHVEHMEGKVITIQGKALNSKAGAMAGDYFVDGLHGWPEEVQGKMVEVTGKLRSMEHREEDLYDEEGAVRQGMVGTQQVLLRPKWHVVEE